MKRTFITALSLSLLAGSIVGCTKNDMMRAPDGKEMSFSTHVSTTTKGSVKSAFSIGDRFAIMATESAVNWSATDANWYMGGGADSYVTVTNSQMGNNTAWSYNPIKLWPEANNVSFFAFSPVATATNGISNVNATAGSPTLDFEVNDDIKGQIDLLRAESLDKFEQEVELAFSHALTRVSFAAKANVTSTQRVRLDKITLKGIKNTGSLKLYDDTRTIGDLSDMGGWSGQAGEVDYSPALTHEVASLVTTDLMPMTAEDQALFMIPQEFAAGSKAVLEVVYSYSNDEGKKWINNATLDINLNEYTQFWNPSKSYRYVLTLSPDKIYSFGADIVEWDDEIDVNAKNPLSIAELVMDPTGGLPTELVVTETRGQALGYTLKSSDAAWITIGSKEDGTDAKGELIYAPDGSVSTKAYETEKKLYVFTQPNSTGADRAGKVTLVRAGMADIVIPVKQSGFAPPLKDCSYTESVAGTTIQEVTGMLVPGDATLTYTLKTDADWFTMSNDGNVANATNELTVTPTVAGQPQSFYVHTKANMSTTTRPTGTMSFVATSTVGTELVMGTMTVKQMAHPQPLANVVTNTTIQPISESIYTLTKMATVAGAEYTVAIAGTGALLSVDGTGYGAASIKFTAKGSESSFYLHASSNISRTATRTWTISCSTVQGGTTKQFTQAATTEYYVGRFAGAVRTEAVGAETHYYFDKMLFAAAANDASSVWASTSTQLGINDIMNGKANTLRLNTSAFPAAFACWNKTSTPANSFYLPAHNQLLGLIFSSAVASVADGNYWSSTEVNATNAWYAIIGNGYANSNITKNTTTNIRCVREGL